MSHSGYFSHDFDEVKATHYARGAVPSLSQRFTLTMDAITRYVADAIEAYRFQRRVQRIARDLSDLDDKTLYDIGLHRWQIWDMAETVARNPGADFHALRHQL